MADRVLLLIPTHSYKSEDFLEATARLGVELVVGTDRRQALELTAPGHTLALDFVRTERGLRRIVEFARHKPLCAVIGTDDETSVLAAMAQERLGLPHNPVEAVRAARDKHASRRRWSAAGLRGPRFRCIAVRGAKAWAERVDYPCVIKPLGLSASRGVIRADEPRAFAAACARIGAILRDPEVAALDVDTEHLLVEDYLPGREVALEGLLEDGGLRVLALFDKPDPLEGPTFEETLYLTPSSLPREVRRAVAAEAGEACRVLGLRDGAVHAELRVHCGRPVVLEVAPRTIGGLCSRMLRFGTGVRLEELILRHHLRRDTTKLVCESGASGVMMIPIPARGLLREVRGLERAGEVAGIHEITLTRHVGAELVPLPEGHRYLGFIFARGGGPEQVERALRQAHARLEFRIE